MRKGFRSRQERDLTNREISEYRRGVLAKLGLRVDDYPKWKEKWANHCGSAYERGIKNRITFATYVKKAVEAGAKRPSAIGQTAGKLQLGRIGDDGPYTKSSCRFITMEQNQEERKLNGGTAIAVEKAARIRRGQTKETHEHIAAMAEKLSGRSAETHEYLAEAGRKRGREFEIFSPNGKRYTGQSLNAFCKAKRLNQAGMSLLCRGLKPSFNGWTGSYTDEAKPYHMKRKKKCKTRKKEAAM